MARAGSMKVWRPGTLIVWAVLGAACATNPVTGEREFTLMSESQEIAIGQQADVEIRQQMGVYEDAGLQEYVETIGLQLARGSQRPDLPWHFTVVDSTAVNAFALPGGYIYLTRGIIAYLNDEAELAGVLGHEIGHVTARHAVRQYSRATGAQLGLVLSSIFVPGARAAGDLAGFGLGVLFLRYGREDELQADRLGAEYAAQQGWSPGGVGDMLTTLARIAETSNRQGVPNWLSTHPQPEDRVERIQETLARLQQESGGSEWRVNRGGFLERLQGLVFGDDPREGVLRGSTFLHSELRFSIEFPEGWDVTNTPQQVVAREPGNDVYLVLELVEQPQGRDIAAIAQADMRRANFRQREGGATEINGLSAYLGTYTGRVNQLGDVVARVAHIAQERRVYRVAGLTPTAVFERVEPQFSRSLRSFRELSRREAGDLRPNKLDFYTVRQGDTWQSIAQGPGQGNVPAATLAIMNSFPPSEQPQRGDRIKIVVAG